MGLPTWDPIAGKWVNFEPYIPEDIKDPTSPYTAGFTDPIYSYTDPKTGETITNVYDPPKNKLGNVAWIATIAAIGLLGYGLIKR